jgi:hypothetical protein
MVVVLEATTMAVRTNQETLVVLVEVQMLVALQELLTKERAVEQLVMVSQVAKAIRQVIQVEVEAVAVQEQLALQEILVAMVQGVQVELV